MGCMGPARRFLGRGAGRMPKSGSARMCSTSSSVAMGVPPQSAVASAPDGGARGKSLRKPRAAAMRAARVFFSGGADAAHPVGFFLFIFTKWVAHDGVYNQPKEWLLAAYTARPNNDE